MYFNFFLLICILRITKNLQIIICKKYGTLHYIITIVIRGIPKEKYENIFKGAYNRDVVYVKNKTRKRKSAFEMLKGVI